MFGLGEADIDAGLARFGAGEQELQRDRGLSGTGTAFEQVQPVAEANPPPRIRRGRILQWRRGAKVASWRPSEDALFGQLLNAIGKSAPMPPHHGRQRKSSAAFTTMLG